MLSTSRPPASQGENVPATAATIAVRSSTSAVPSLTRLSPSTMSISRRGTPSRRPIAVAAIGSVGDTTAPRTNASAQREVGDRVRDEATPTVVSATSPTASSEIGRRFRRSSRSAGGERREVEERRQDADQHDLRRHRHLRHAGPEADQQPAEDEQDRVRDPQRPGEHQQRRARDEQDEELELLPGRRTRGSPRDRRTTLRSGALLQ